MEIYSTLVSEILKYYYDVEDINGYDYDEFLTYLLPPSQWKKKFSTICALYEMWMSYAMLSKRATLSSDVALKSDHN